MACRARASRQRREDRDDVARGERTSAHRVLTVHEHDPREVGRDSQAARDVVDGRSFRDVKRDATLRIGSWQVREEGCEEPDFDLQSSIDSPYRLAIEFTVSSGRTT